MRVNQFVDAPKGTISVSVDLPETDLIKGKGGPEPLIPFNPDTRAQVNDTTVYPHNSIGQVIMEFPNGKRYAGTGTLLDEYYVLTCAHNLFSYNDGGYATRVDFYPARNGDNYPYGRYSARRFFLPQEYAMLHNPDPNEHGVVEDYTQYMFDFGLIQLSQPVGNAGYLGMYAARDEDLEALQVNITGYPGDKPRGTMWGADGIFDRGISEEFLFYTISTYRGQSGSAVKGHINGLDPNNNLRIVGVHVAGSQRLYSNFAVRLNQDVVDRINGWM
jgi:glutamyl endopeptidase